MKINKIFLVSMLLLAIITLGAVSATDDSGDLTASDMGDAIIDSSDDEDIVADDSEELMDSGGYVNGGTTSAVDLYDCGFDVYIPQDEVDGNIYIYVNNTDEAVYQTAAESLDNEIYYSSFADHLSYGNNTIFIQYKDSNMYLPFNNTWIFEYKMYDLDVYDEYFISPIHTGYISVSFQDDVTGQFVFKIDNKIVKDSSEDGMESYYHIYFDDLKLGNHTWSAKYSNGNYPAFSKSGKFRLDYDFDVKCDDFEIGYGDEITFEIEAPSDLNTIIVSYNGKTKTVELDEGYGEVSISDLELGNVNIIFKAPKQGRYYESEKTYEVIVSPKLDLTDIRYNSDDGVCLKLPSDATGNLLVIIDDGEAISVPFKDGVAQLKLSGYPMGYHDIILNYTGEKYNFYEESSFDVVPNVKYDTILWNGTVNVVSIELPSDGTGKFTVEAYDDFSKTVNVVNGKATITLPPFTSYSESSDISFEYFDGNYDDYSDSYSAVLMDSPSNTPIRIEGENQTLKGQYKYIQAFIADGARGYMNLTIDGKYVDSIDVRDSIGISTDEYEKYLSYGNHVIRLDYSGDNYYQNTSCEFNFEVVHAQITIPDTVYKGEYSCVEIWVDDAVKGSAEIYVDGKKYEANMRPTLHSGECYRLSYDISGLDFGKYDVRVVFKSTNGFDQIEDNATVNVDYSMEIYGVGSSTYGYDHDLTIEFVVNATGSVDLFVNGAKYTSQIKNRIVEFKLPASLAIGTYQLSANYSGDDNFPAKSITFNDVLDVCPSILLFNGASNIIDGYNVTLALPSDAAGSLEVEIMSQGSIIKSYSQPLVNGRANIPIDLKVFGDYDVSAKYTGDDYNVEDIGGYFSMSPKISYNRTVYVGQENILTFEVPSDATGNLTIKYGEEEIPYDFNNGKVTVTLPAYYEETTVSLRITFEDDVYGTYDSEDGDYLEVDVFKYLAGINATAPTGMSANYPAGFVFTLPDDASGEIYFELDNNTFSGEVLNGKCTVYVKLPVEGNYTLLYHYSGDGKYSEDIGEVSVEVAPKPSIKAVDITVLYSAGTMYKPRIFDSYGNAVGAGESVTIFINNKKVATVKTDKNGYAPYKVTQAPNKYNIKIAYKGASLTKKLTVKHVVTLKTVTVKKSAKKLILQATLAKVNGKYLKNKKVTFKFNGKTYKAKTNKKGIAKVTIKSSVLKKLKVGKKVTYQATYLKDIVKKTAKVKK